MNYILGLDVGTSSIGLAAYTLDQKGNPAALLHLECRLFKEPSERSKTGYHLKNETRRLKRLARRQVARKHDRFRKVHHFFKEHDLLQGERSDHNIFALRAKAINKKITLTDLYHICAQLAKGRGYMGSLHNAEGAVSKGIQALEDAMAAAGCQTIGQYWYQRQQQNQATRTKWKHLNESGTYKHRQMIEDEFDLIFATQADFHPELRREISVGKASYYHHKFDASQRYPLGDLLRHVIFYQHPLRWSTDTIGTCSLFAEEKCVSRASPSFQHYRLWKTVTNLMLKNHETKATTPLNEEQRAIVLQRLQSQKECSFTSLYKALDLSENQYSFTHDRRAQTGDAKAGLKGDETLAAMKAMKLAPDWQKLSPLEQEGVVDFLANLNDPELVFTPKLGGYDDLSAAIAALVSYPLPDEAIGAVQSFVEALSQHKKFGSLSKMGLPTKRASYGHKALELITEGLQDGIAEEDTIPNIIADYDLEPPKEHKDQLVFDYDDLPANPVVTKALKETARSFNYMLKRFGKPTRVVLELNRAMKQSLEQRTDTEKTINQNQKARAEAAAEIEKHGAIANRANILRYRLWKEQGEHCAYTGQKLELSQLFNPLETEVDHIVPRARGGKNQQWNLVVVTKGANQDKANKTPFEAFATHPSNWTAITKLAEQWAKKKPTKQKAALLISEADPQDSNSFTDSQNQDTAWIARTVKTEIEALGEIDVLPIRGRLTAYMRQYWGIDRILPQVRHEEGKPLFNEQGDIIPYADWADQDKEMRSNTKNHFDKRCDHRHHMIDAAVLGLISRSLFQAASRYNRVHGDLFSRHEKWQTARNHSGFMRTDQGKREQHEPYAGFMRELKQAVLHYLPWKKPDFYPTGGFFKENPYGLKANNKGGGRLYQRIALTSLAEKLEKAHPKGKADDIFDKIVGDDIRSNIKTQFYNRLDQGLSIKDALCGQAPYKDESEDDLPLITPTLPDGRADGIYYPAHTQNRVQKIRYSDLQYRPEVDKIKSVGSTKKGQQVWSSDSYAALDVSADGKNRRFIPLSETRHSPQAPQGYKRFFKTQTVYHQPSKQFYEVISINFGNDRLGLIALTEAVSDYTKAQGKTSAAKDSHPNYTAHLQLASSKAHDLIPVNSQRDLVRLMQEAHP